MGVGLPSQESSGVVRSPAGERRSEFALRPFHNAWRASICQWAANGVSAPPAGSQPLQVSSGRRVRGRWALRRRS